jgi:hypothetical protein
MMLSNRCIMTSTRTQKQWPLLAGGRCSKVVYALKVSIGTSKFRIEINLKIVLNINRTPPDPIFDYSH